MHVEITEVDDIWATAEGAEGWRAGLDLGGENAREEESKKKKQIPRWACLRQAGSE